MIKPNPLPGLKVVTVPKTRILCKVNHPSSFPAFRGRFAVRLLLRASPVLLLSLRELRCMLDLTVKLPEWLRDGGKEQMRLRLFASISGVDAYRAHSGLRNFNGDHSLLPCVNRTSRPLHLLSL